MRGTGGKALQLNKPENHIWFLEHDAAGQGAELLKKGGRVKGVRFKLPGGTTGEPNQFALGIYWQLSSLPEGVTLAAGRQRHADVLLPADGCDEPERDAPQEAECEAGYVRGLDNGWHTLAFEFAGNNSIQVTPVLDETNGDAVHTGEISGIRMAVQQKR